MVTRLILRNLIPLLFLLIIVAALIGCSTTKGNFCSIAEPIRLSAAQVDRLSDAEVKALLSHNRKGQALCSWKP